MNRKIPWWHPNLGEAEKTMLAKVIDNQFPNHGSYTIEFEEKIAEICGTSYAVAVTSGTAALFLSMKAAGIGVGDEVIVPDITFIATIHAVSLTGATPVIVDVKDEDLTIDVQAVKRAITSRTKAVIPVHLSGRAVQIEQLVSLCKEHQLFLIEDATEALGSVVNEKPIGSFGFTGCFSFTATKLVTTGQGGMVVVDNEETYYKIRALRDHGRVNRGTGGNDVHDTIGYNFKFTDLQAAVGVAQLDTFASRLNKQKELYCEYKTQLNDVAQIKLLPFNIPKESPLWIDAIVENRRELSVFLEENGIESRSFWKPLHRQKPYYTSDELYPISSVVADKAIWLPSALSLTSEEVKYICSKIREFYKVYA